MDQQRIIELRTMPYDQYLQTPEWAAKREQALERDGRRCRACDSRENLNVHHRTYARRGNEDMDDLTTFCQPCHEHFHKRIDQEHMMQQTYDPPFDLDAWREEHKHNKEYHLIGVLIKNPDLFPHVAVILSEKDFPTSELRALFHLLATPSDQPFDDRVASELKPVVLKAMQVLEEYPFDMSDAMNVNSVVFSACRIKKSRLMEEHTRLMEIAHETLQSGDKEAVNEIRQKAMAIMQQVATMNNTMKPKSKKASPYKKSSNFRKQ